MKAEESPAEKAMRPSKDAITRKASGKPLLIPSLGDCGDEVKAYQRQGFYDVLSGHLPVVVSALNFTDVNDAVTSGIIFTEFIIKQKLKQLKICIAVKMFITIVYSAPKEHLIWKNKTGNLHL